MKPLSIQTYPDYKTFLKDLLKREGRGSQTTLASGLRCTKSYLSQVLNGSNHLTSEQGFQVARFAALDVWATRFLLLLIQHARAQNHELKDFYAQEIEQARKKRIATVAFDEEREARLQAKYRAEFYSTWRYMAINKALLVPKLNTPSAISAYLGIPAREVTRVLERLVVMGLVAAERGKYRRASDSSLVLDADPLLIEGIHRSCLGYLSDALDRSQKYGNYYSAFWALSQSDMKAISAILSRATQEIQAVGTKAKEPEHLYFVGMGFARAWVEE